MGGQGRGYEEYLDPQARGYEGYVDSGVQGGPDYSGGGPQGEPQKVNSPWEPALKAVGGAAIVGGLTYAGGLPFAAGSIPAILGETAASFPAELLRQKAFGEPTDYRAAGETALMTGGPGLLFKGATKAFGALGGVAPQFQENAAREGVRGYRLTRPFMPPPSAQESVDLAQNIGEAIPTGQTAARTAKEALISQATQAGNKVSIQPVIDDLKGRLIKAAAEPSAMAFNNRLTKFINNLQLREQAGGMNPEELDSLLTKQLDPKMYRGGKPSSNMAAQAYSDARDSARATLMKSLPQPEAENLTGQISSELQYRRLAKSSFGLDPVSQQATQQTVNRVRNLFTPKQVVARNTLQKISEESGIDWVSAARDLATKTAFSADDTRVAPIIGRITEILGIGALASGHPGGAAAIALSNPTIARNITRIIAPLQNMAGPGGASMWTYLKQRYGMRSAPSQAPASQPAEQTPQKEAPSSSLWKQSAVKTHVPEEMFPEMTNKADN